MRTVVNMQFSAYPHCEDIKSELIALRCQVAVVICGEVQRQLLDMKSGLTVQEVLKSCDAKFIVKNFKYIRENFMIVLKNSRLYKPLLVAAKTVDQGLRTQCEHGDIFMTTEPLQKLVVICSVGEKVRTTICLLLQLLTDDNCFDNILAYLETAAAASQQF